MSTAAAAQRPRPAIRTPLTGPELFTWIALRRVHGPRQVTDAYLLALAVRRSGRFVTFDRSVALSAVPGATAENLTFL